MDKETQIIKPNYNRIYKDIVDRKFPEKKEMIYPLLQTTLSVLDIIQINQMLFQSVNNNQLYKSYTEKDIQYILQYQLENKLTNISLSKQFNISRNTIASWRKIFFK